MMPSYSTTSAVFVSAAAGCGCATDADWLSAIVAKRATAAPPGRLHIAPVSLDRWFGRLQMRDVLVVLLAGVGHDPIVRLLTLEQSRHRPRLREEDRILERDRPLDRVVGGFVEPLREPGLVTVLV